MSLPTYVDLDTYKSLELRVSEIEKKLQELELEESYHDDSFNDDSFGEEDDDITSDLIPKPPSLVDRCIPSLMSGNVSVPADVKFPAPITKPPVENKLPEKKVRVCKKEPKEAKRLDGTVKKYISGDSANFWSAISFTYDKYKKAVPENRLRWNQFRAVFSKFWHAASAVDKDLWAKEGTTLDWNNLSTP